MCDLHVNVYFCKHLNRAQVGHGIAVHSDARGKGAGSYLLQEVAKYAKDH
ncbi:GNAT family N-acetyltransferase [Glaciecola sp. 33A]